MPRPASRLPFARVALLISTLLLALGLAAAPASAARLTASSSGFCAVTADGDVACWGTNLYGRLGTPGTTRIENPGRPSRVPGVASARSVTSTTDRGCALTGDGTILCWGAVGTSDLANGVPATAVASVPGATDLVLTDNHLCAKGEDRALTCAAFPKSQAKPGTFTPLRGATRISSITAKAEGRGFCVTRSKGGALCVGDGFAMSNVQNLSVEREEGGARVVAATTTFANRCLADRSGRVRCTGGDPFDPLVSQGVTSAPADGRNRYRVVAGIKDAIGLSSGSALCVIRRGGFVSCLNPNDAVEQRRPRAAKGGRAEIVRGISGVEEVATTYGTTCAIRTGGAVWCWGTGATGHGPSFSATPVTVTGLTGATSITAGRTHTCAVERGGKVSCWGAATAGAFGARFAPSAETVKGIHGATAVAATERGTCALTLGSALRCWGPIGARALAPVEPFTVAKARSETATPVGLSGDCLQIDARIDCLALRYPKVTPKKPDPRPTGLLITQPGIAQVAEVADDGSVRCATHVDRTVTCAGTGWLAPQTERGSVAAGPTVMPGLTGVVRLSVGERGACAVLTGGRVTCLAGADPTYDSASPLPPEPASAPAAGSPGHLLPGIDDAVAVEADGPGGPCVVRSSGTVRCARVPTDPAVPVDASTPRPYVGYDVPGIDDATAISAGPLHTCVLRRTGTVACWGDGAAGQLGDGPAPLGHGPQLRPTPVAGLVAPTN